MGSNSGIEDDYPVEGVPTLVLIDGAGNMKIENYHLGCPGYEALKAEIDAILAFLKSDLNQDGAVNIQDLYIVAKAFGSRPGDLNWNETADVDKNGIVNIVDVFKVAKNFGKSHRLLCRLTS